MGKNKNLLLDENRNGSNSAITQELKSSDILRVALPRKFLNTQCL